MKAMFARVVPALRTPVGVEGFDYRVPEGCAVECGDVARILFRGRPQIGLVTDLREQSPFAHKASPLQGVMVGMRLPETLLGLLAWTAAVTFQSQPTVFKSWIHTLPHRLPEKSLLRQTRLPFGGTWQHHWQTDPLHALVEKSKALLRKHQRLLILTPWLASAEHLRALLPESGMLHSGMTNAQAFRAWHGFLSGEMRCLITTRLGAWLAPCADQVLIQEPEQDGYKQDELAPRYDARKMVEWCATHAGTRVESFGLTPPLAKEEEPAPTIDAALTIHVRHPQGRSKIPLVQADTLNAVRDHLGPRVIIHPIRGLLARLVCRDCGWRATCEACGFGLSETLEGTICRHCGKKRVTPESCPHCHGADLGKSLPGIEKLKQAWAVHEPDTTVEWRDLSPESMDRPFPSEALVVVTDAALLGGMSEDVRRRERQCLAFRRLADRVRSARGRLLIQCHEELAALWPSWLTNEGVQAFHTQERKERALFGYPPAMRLVKAIITGSEQDAISWSEKAKKLDFRGPFPVAYRLRARQSRWIFHLLFPAETTDAVLMETLAPLAGQAILDLDPVAFFA